MKNKSIISEIFKFSDMLHLVQKLDSKSLVLFDVDDVIIPTLSDQNLEETLNLRLHNKKNTITGDQKELALSIILQNRKPRILDASFSDLLNLLHVNKLPSMALTKLFSERFGVISNPTEWRIQELLSLGVNFSQLTPISEEISLDDYDTGYGAPKLKEGVILTSDVDKGLVLDKIMEKKNYYPETVVFFDDLEENIEAVKIICDKNSINYHGYIYKGADIEPSANIDEEKELILSLLKSQKTLLSLFK